MENICNREICTGCGLCHDLCPEKAISMEEDRVTGHYIPKVNAKNCVNCGICKKHCPSLVATEYKKEIITYAAWRKDSSKRTGSSSGGVAAEFYEVALSQGYDIVGTYMPSACSAKMKLTDSMQEIENFKGSKYIQADCNETYSDSLNRLKAGGKVLFAGLPCQCVAMRAAAGELYMSRLLTVELICHGTPSQKVFADYVKMIERKKRRKITKAFFRGPWGAELTLLEGEQVVWKRKAHEDEFLKSFEEGMLQNAACYRCLYAREERISDITIGDFWEIGSEIPFNRPDCMVSVVIVSSQKGMGFLDLCKGLQLVERDYQEAINGNPNLKYPLKRHPQKDVFWMEYQKKGIEAAYKATIGREIKKKYMVSKAKNSIKACVKFVKNMTTGEKSR